MIGYLNIHKWMNIYQGVAWRRLMSPLIFSTLSGILAAAKGITEGLLRNGKLVTFPSMVDTIVKEFALICNHWKGFNSKSMSIISKFCTNILTSIRVNGIC